MRELLAEYAAGTLPAGDRERVARHLAGCAECRTELASWAALADRSEDPPGADIVRSALLTSAMTGLRPVDRTARMRWRLPLDLLRAQIPLMRASFWLACAVVMAVGTLLASRSAPAVAHQILTLVAPILAALGIAVVCGPERDPAFEVCAATPTGPRLVLLARVALVFGYNLVVDLAAAGALRLLGGPARDAGGLAIDWLGPMALLSALALLGAVVVGADVAVGIAVTLWVLRLGANGWLGVPTGWLSPVREAWATSPGTVTAAIVLTAVAGYLAGRGEPLRRRGATHPV
jgi:anti-sigma factor RsiW